ncbi:MAG TPA: glycosyltransferase family 39 protein [Thermoanaerobaculia bacterium]|nr:glycosyltransferase family 39 protein [Thermoanaerobaculia bacterium]
MEIQPPAIDRPSRTETWALRGLFAWALLLFAVGIWWGLPNWIAWAGDELHPTSWHQAISPATPRGWHARYPPLHFVLLYWTSWPLRLLLDHKVLSLDDYDANSLLIYFSRLVSLAMAMATLGLVYRVGREVYDRRSALGAVFVTASIAPFVYYAKMGNLDIPYLCWFALSLLAYVRCLKYGRGRDFLLFGAAAAAAVCTKDQAYGLYMLAPLALITALYRHDFRDRGPVKGVLRALVDPRLLAGGATSAVLFAVFQNLFWNLERFQIHVRQLLGPMSEGYRDFPDTWDGHLALLQLFLRQIVFALNPALTAACVAGLLLTVYQAVIRKEARDRQEVFLLGSLFLLVVSYYVTFLNLILFTYDRYVLPVALLLAFFGGKTLGTLLAPRAPGNLRPRRPVLRWAAVALVALVGIYSVLYASSVDFRLLADSRYFVESWLEQRGVKPEQVLAVGRPHHVPRFERLPWENVLRSHGRALLEREPEYVTINLTDIRRPAEAEMVERLGSGELGYRKVLDHQSRPFLDFLSADDVGSSQRFIDPEMAVFARNPG